jgi:hypothetical protein
MGSGFDSSLPCVLCSIPHSPSLVKPAISSAKSSSVASQRPFSLHCARELASTQPPERVPVRRSGHQRPAHAPCQTTQSQTAPLTRLARAPPPPLACSRLRFCCMLKLSCLSWQQRASRAAANMSTQSGPVEERRHPADQTRRKAIVLLLRQRSTTHERTGDAAPGRHDRRHDSRR